jgi:hypothetical protein
MATVTVALPSGLTDDVCPNLNDKVKPSISSCGYYLNLKVQWPDSIANTGTIKCGWSGDRKLGDNCKVMYDDGVLISC